MIIKGNPGEVHLYSFEYIIYEVQLLCFRMLKSLPKKSGFIRVFFYSKENMPPTSTLMQT